MRRPRVITAATLVELKAKIYKAEKWRRVQGESATKRIADQYSVNFDFKTNRIRATRKENT